MTDLQIRRTHRQRQTDRDRQRQTDRDKERKWLDCVYRGLISLISLPVRAAMSSIVSLFSEMIPTPLAMALAVIGWSPVIIMTLMPAERHFDTASGTAALGGSIIDMSPTKRRPVRGKFSSSPSPGNPMGNSSSGRK